MKAAAFDYLRPTSLADALAQATAGTRLIAGGQSLGPMLNLRLAVPATVLDIRRLTELRSHRLDAGRLFIGAAVTHAQIEDGLLPDTTRGMLVSVARNIAYRAIRNRGTIGGSLAHADPAADWVNSLVALGAQLHLAGPQGRRVVPAAQFIRGAYQTALVDGEILTAVELPAFTAAMRWGYYKINTKVGEFASALGAVVVDPGLGMVNLLVGAIEAPPLLLPDAAGLLELAYEPLRDRLLGLLSQRLPAADPVFIHQHAVALARAVGQSRESRA